MYKASFDQNLLNEWCDYCEGKKKFDSCYFSTLLMETLLEGYTPEFDKFIIEITKYFDSSIYKNIKYTFNNKEHKEGDIKDWVINDLREKRKIILQMADSSKLVAIIDNPEYLMTNDREQLYDALESDNNTILYEGVGDYVRENIEKDYRMYGLKEVLYNIASDYDLVYGILAGIVKGKVDLSNYLDIYKNGFDYAVSEEKIIIYTPTKQTVANKV